MILHNISKWKKSDRILASYGHLKVNWKVNWTVRKFSEEGIFLKKKSKIWKNKSLAAIMYRSSLEKTLPKTFSYIFSRNSHFSIKTNFLTYKKIKSKKGVMNHSTDRIIFSLFRRGQSSAWHIFIYFLFSLNLSGQVHNDRTF